jgi:hypothetical protein
VVGEIDGVCVPYPIGVFITFLFYFEIIECIHIIFENLLVRPLQRRIDCLEAMENIIGNRMAALEKKKGEQDRN